MQRNTIIQILEDGVMNSLIRKNAGDVIDPLRFRKEHGNSPEVSEVIRILHLYNKAAKKLPTWVRHLAAMNAKSYEQASSEETAAFKASLFDGERMLNMTGGLGVDDVAFSSAFREVVSLEIDPEVHEMARYNMEKMGVSNVDRQLLSAEKYLESTEGTFDLVYIDPDRRPGAGGRTFILENSSPNVLEIQDEILSKSKRLLLKLSPMFDLSEAQRVLHGLRRIIVLSSRNEVKEILTIQEHAFQGPVEILCADIRADGSVLWFGKKNMSENEDIVEKGTLFLYESGAAVIKANLIREQGEISDLEQISRSPFHLGRIDLRHFLGKKYLVLWEMDVKWDAIKKKLAAEQIERVHVTAREFHIRPKEILKKLRIEEGGDVQLIFTVNGEKRAVVYCCKRLS